MWTETTQQQYRRDSLRYASDVTDEEWALIEGFLPRPRKLGRPRTTEMREVVNALLYLLTTDCQWRLLPKGISAVLGGSSIFLSMAGCWAVADDQSFFGDVRTRGQWP